MWGSHGTPRSRIDFLHTVPLFEGLPDKVVARLDGHVNDLHVAAGTELTTQGGAGYETFIVVDGTAAVIVDGKEVAELGPGELIGEIAVLEHRARTASVRARTAMQLLVVDAREIQWLFTHPDLSARVREILARHLDAGRSTATEAP